MTTQLDGLLSAPLPGGGGVALCCVRLFVWGVHVSMLCTNPLLYSLCTELLVTVDF
jgi:hypothetical protein